jgi:hypothetical protein
VTVQGPCGQRGDGGARDGLRIDRMDADGGCQAAEAAEPSAGRHGRLPGDGVDRGGSRSEHCPQSTNSMLTKLKSMTPKSKPVLMQENTSVEQTTDTLHPDTLPLRSIQDRFRRHFARQIKLSNGIKSPGITPAYSFGTVSQMRPSFRLRRRLKAIDYVQRLTSIPVPRIMDSHLNARGSEHGWILMERIPGAQVGEASARMRPRDFFVHADLSRGNILWDPSMARLRESWTGKWPGFGQSGGSTGKP